MAKRAKPKAPAPLVLLEPDGSFHVYLSSGLNKERETLRRLAHRVVDLLADSNRCRGLVDTLEGDLEPLCEGVIREYVTDLIGEARAQGKGVRGG